MAEKFVLQFGFAPLLGLTVRRKGNVYVVHVCLTFCFLFFNELRLFYSLALFGCSFWVREIKVILLYPCLGLAERS